MKLFCINHTDFFVRLSKTCEMMGVRENHSHKL